MKRETRNVKRGFLSRFTFHVSVLRCYGKPLRLSRRSRRTVYRGAPVAVLGNVASHDIEVELLEGAAKIADPAVANGAVVNRACGGNLSASTAEDQLVAHV